jgi:uncharacterized membrane protein YphA (DoxX/SURF4 family)
MNAIVETLPADPSRRLTVLIWVLRVSIAAVFVPAGVMKIAGASMAVGEFQSIGLGDWFRYVTGLLELAGAALVLTPSRSAFGALLLLAVDVGAFVAQVAVLHGRDPGAPRLARSRKIKFIDSPVQ